MKKLSKEQFVEKSNKIHNNKYNYSLVEYINNRTKIKIVCSIHGVFEQKADSHLFGKGCPSCSNNLKLSLEQFIIKSNKIHNDKYNYSLIKQINGNKRKIKIICPEHGLFEQTPNKHLIGCGCPKCGINFSKGESQIEKWLMDHNINYKTQYKFVNCKNVYQLPFDFFLPDYNMCIEFDGLHHYEPVRGLKKLLSVCKHDNIKNKYCLDSNITLVRIPYWEQRKIDEIMTNMILPEVKNNLSI